MNQNKEYLKFQMSKNNLIFDHPEARIPYTMETEQK